MKEMKYLKERAVILLHKNTYKDFNYWIISYGTHPCAYVEIPKNHPYYKKSYMDIEDIEVHGGLTFSSDKLLLLDNSWFLGWDYAHYGDYCGYILFEIENEKKWTTEEIDKECKYVIDQLEGIR